MSAKNTQHDDQKKYELMVVINPELGENGIQEKLQSIREQLISGKGEIFHEDLWGLRDLTYPIKKREQGYYAIFNFLTQGSRISELNKSFHLEADILRHMITLLPSNYEPKNYFEEKEEEEKESVSPEKEVKSPKSTTKEDKKKPSKAQDSGKLQGILENPDLNF